MCIGPHDDGKMSHGSIRRENPVRPGVEERTFLPGTSLLQCVAIHNPSATICGPRPHT